MSFLSINSALPSIKKMRTGVPGVRIGLTFAYIIYKMIMNKYNAVNYPHEFTEYEFTEL